MSSWSSSTDLCTGPVGRADRGPGAPCVRWRIPTPGPADPRTGSALRQRRHGCGRGRRGCRVAARLRRRSSRRPSPTAASRCSSLMRCFSGARPAQLAAAGHGSRSGPASATRRSAASAARGRPLRLRRDERLRHRPDGPGSRRHRLEEQRRLRRDRPDGDIVDRGIGSAPRPTAACGARCSTDARRCGRRRPGRGCGALRRRARSGRCAGCRRELAG